MSFGGGPNSSQQEKIDKTGKIQATVFFPENAILYIYKKALILASELIRPIKVSSQYSKVHLLPVSIMTESPLKYPLFGLASVRCSSTQ